MRCQVIKSFNRRGEIQNPGSIIEVPDDALSKLAGYVQVIQPTTRDPKTFPHYCKPSDSWCSGKLPGREYPKDCINHHCEYYHASQDATQGLNDTQGTLTLA